MSETEPPEHATKGDEEWFVLTQGMEPYERFSYIVRHVLETAIEDAEAYVDDARIFEDVDLEDADAVEAHLRELDTALREDEALSQLEREFLCAAVSRVMREHDLDARCYGELFRLARPVNGDGGQDGCD